MSSGRVGEPGVGGDVELDLLLLSAKASALNVLDTSLDIEAGLAAIRTQHEHAAASRPPPARAGPEADPRTAHLDEPTIHDEPRYGTEGNLP